jgi:phytoene dehydrogenase-like protein
MAVTRKKVPIAIVGGGIAGLAAAACLERAGLDYLLVESQDSAELGGLVRGQQEQGIWLDYGLKSLPAGPELADNPLIRLKKRLNLEFQIESFDLPTKIPAKNEMTDFMGFGETGARALIEELGYYTQSPRLLVSGGWKFLIDELLTIIPEEKIASNSHVTRIEIEDDRVTSIMINGSATVQVDRVIFTLSPILLKELLRPNTLSPRIFQRIAKTEPFTAIALDIATEKTITDAKNVFLLSDSSEDTFYVLGQFVTNVDPLKHRPGVQISSWLTLVPAETLQDDESGSKAIRTMKKVIKKTFPELLEKKSWERLLVVPNAIGHFEQLLLEKNGTLPGLGNLWMAGAQLKGESRGTSNALRSAMFSADQVIAQLLPAGLARETSPQTEISP